MGTRIENRESPLDQIRDKYEGLNKCPSIVPTILKKISKAEFLQKTKAANQTIPPISSPNTSQPIIPVETPEPKKPTEPVRKTSRRGAVSRKQIKINGKFMLNQMTQTNLDSKNEMIRTKRFIDTIKTPAELKVWTGLDGFDTLDRLVYLIAMRESKDLATLKFAMNRTDRILATLIRMHLNLPMKCIAMMCGIDHKYVTKMIWPNFLEIRSVLEGIKTNIPNIPKLKEFEDNLNRELLADEMADEVTIKFVPKRSKS
jgi:hypothetical protein